MKEYQLNPKFVTVITTDQGHVVLMPNGVRLPAITKVVTNDTWGEMPLVEVTMQCNLAKTGVELDTETTPIELAYKEKIDILKEEIKYQKEYAQRLEQESFRLRNKWWFRLFSKFDKTTVPKGKIEYPFGYQIDWDKSNSSTT